jgi:glycosyltransferase involved in cell wall biosynthesis
VAELNLDVAILAGRLEGTAESTVRDLVGRLVTRGVRASVVCLAAASDAATSAGVPFVRVPGLARFWTRPWTVRTHRCFTQGEHSKPRLLHVVGLEMAEAGLALAERWEIPYAITVDDFPALGARFRTSRRWCKRIVVPGLELARQLAERLGVPEGAIAIIPPGIKLPGCRRWSSAHPHTPVIGTAGAPVEAAGLATFLAAAGAVFAAGIDAEFVIAGRGREDVIARRLAAYSGLAERITFVQDWASRHADWEALDLFCAASLVPSSGRQLVAALAHGIPAITSDVAGLRSWIVPGETAVLVPPGDAQALAAAMLDLLGDPARARQLGMQARAWIASECCPDREAQSLVSLYRAVSTDTAMTPFVKLGHSRAHAARSR